MKIRRLIALLMAVLMLSFCTTAIAEQAMTVDDIVDSIKVVLAQYTDDYSVTGDETGIIVSFAIDGMASEIMAKSISASLDDWTTWKMLRMALLGWQVSIEQSMRAIGCEEPTVMIMMLNDQNKDNAFMGIGYGIVAFDITDSLK